MAGPAIVLPTPGGSSGTWGTTLNAALNQLNDYDVFKRKAVDESVTSSVTLQNDDDLVAAVVASATYLVEWDLRIDGATAGDFKYAWTGPAGATMRWVSLGHAVGDTTNVAQTTTDVAAIGTTVSHGTLGTGVSSHVHGSGILIVSTTAGSLQLQWAQDTSSGTATKALINSWLLARRVI